MASEIELRERQKNHLNVLLKVKKDNADIVVKGLQEKIHDAIIPMEKEDVAWVEKIVGVSAIDV